ncbi:MAG: gliding motility-associated C-terminal domain-containing protein, partial [Bacteroidota bacterium]|nr:gliding motility-associated C-terminal domain-containing protein [Bacteroidota bacterium]
VVTVHSEKCETTVYIPNSFTPNNDGLNDYFKPIIAGVFEQYQLTIYNAYGQIVFSTNMIDKSWDGSFKGIQQKSGVFVYICKYKSKNEGVKLIKGSLMLIR